MKRVFFSLIPLLILATSISWAESDTFFPDGLEKEVNTAKKLKNIIDNDDPRFVIVDIRSKAAYRIGHIPSAICRPEGLTSKMKNPLGKDKYIILYCYSGGSAYAARLNMLKEGYKHVYPWGGTFGWPYPLEKSP
jgi:rhodanese-related sulfurtransferase